MEGNKEEEDEEEEEERNVGEEWRWWVDDVLVGHWTKPGMS
jgi:hypothetical protein